jgi:hypothetical protein
MNAETDFDFVLAKGEAGLTDCRQGASVECYPHRTDVLGCEACEARDLLQRRAGLCCRASNLVNQHCTGDATTSFARHGVLERDVIGDDNRFDRNRFRPGSSAARPKFNRSPV